MSIWSGKYVSIYNTIDAVYRDLGLNENININDAVEWIGEAVELLGVPSLLCTTNSVVPITAFRGMLPCDLHELQAARGVMTTVDLDMCIEDLDLAFLPMLETPDLYHMDNCQDAHSDTHGCSSGYTYKKNNNFIFTSFEEGYAHLSYTAIPTDEMGFPLIPDQIKVRKGLEGHLKWKIAFKRWMQGKMRDAVYNKIEQDRDWYMGAAITAARIPSYDGAEGLKNNWLRLIPKINQHTDGFKTFGDPERRYLQNAKTYGGTFGSPSFFHGGTTAK